MQRERPELPQTSGRLFLTDGGLEAEPAMRGGVGAAELAPHALLEHSAGRHALARYYRGFLTAARRLKTGFMLDSPTSKAHAQWSRASGAPARDAARANRDAVDFVADLRDEFFGNDAPIVLNGVIARAEDAAAMTAAEAVDYYGLQVGWLARTDVDMLTGTGFAHAAEAAGLVNAARAVAVPIVLSFRVGADGLLPGGRTLCSLIAEIDAETRSAAAYYTIECAHPDHIRGVPRDAAASRRIKGLRCSAWPSAASEAPSRMATGARTVANIADRSGLRDPHPLLELHHRIATTMPWVNVVGGRLQPPTRKEDRK
jgi:homocysteine S-methyltransferase